MDDKTYIPWVEKYRPVNFDDIVLDKDNKLIFNNIIKNNYIPNILLYGPPGTGKTTTIINLISKFQQKNNQMNKGLMIHLNASDERGIDIIRNQINSFVNSKTLFNLGTKFVILDEVDYMTKNAQQALKYLLQEYRDNIRFCLICNYISKIDTSLQNEFVKLRFNQLPAHEIINFLNIINVNEKQNLTNEQIKDIQCNFKSDIRSMINYMQSNQHTFLNAKVISNIIFNNITNYIKNNNYNEFITNLYKISMNYNIDIKTIIKDYCAYIIRFKPEYYNKSILSNIEVLMHNPEASSENLLNYLLFTFESVI
jgi:replication factor C subunit 3/5